MESYIVPTVPSGQNNWWKEATVYQVDVSIDLQ